jgi:hypothetical protein
LNKVESLIYIRVNVEEIKNKCPTDQDGEEKEQSVLCLLKKEAGITQLCINRPLQALFR